MSFFRRLVAFKLLDLAKIISGQDEFPPVQFFRTRPWLKINGDRTLRLNYCLTKDSVVFDLGGYQGDWSFEIYKRYQPKIYIFEPMINYYEGIDKRFSSINKITVYPFGLSYSTREDILYVDEDKSSIYGSGQEQKIKLVNAIFWFNENDINHVDLMKINIEGAEYDLLEYLLDNNFINNIIDIQVQFHDFVNESDTRMEQIHSRLKRTHELTFQYRYVWENWRRKI